MIYMCYISTSYARMGAVDQVGSGLVAILATWLSSGYLCGYYSRNSSSSGLFSRIATALVPTLSILLLFIVHSWLFQITDAQTRFRGFLIPLVGSVMLSTLAGRGIMSLIEKRSDEWIILCSEGEKSLIERELLSEVRYRYVSCRFFVVTSKNEIQEKIKAIKALGTKVGVAAGTSVLKNDWGSSSLLGLKSDGTKIIGLVSWCERYLQRIPPELVNIGWFLEADGFSLQPRGINWRIKRLTDILGSLALGLITLPFVLLASVLIYMEDRGPIFYKQRRTGLNGETFTIWKLRSMKVDAESSGVKWSMKGDTRVTRIGKLLRATRIDELPQLASVLNGEMSLVGPRPERPEIEVELEAHIPHYRMRSQIRPGLSGWAQVSYPYGASISDSRMKLSYDLYYIRNAGVLIDLMITLKTIQLVLNAKGSSPRAVGECSGSV